MWLSLSAKKVSINKVEKRVKNGWDEKEAPRMVKPKHIMVCEHRRTRSGARIHTCLIYTKRINIGTILRRLVRVYIYERENKIMAALVDMVFS